MTVRLIAAAAFVAAFSASLEGQGMDPTARVTGSGKLPAGWSARFDQPSGALTQVDVRQAGTALAFRSGPAAIFWNTKDVATGSYTVSAIFEQKKSMGHEGYGIFVGGQNLPDPTQSYLYLVIKPQPGTFIINHRNGARPRAIVGETPSDAVNKDAPGTGAATNAIAIRVSRDSVHFYINGKEVRNFAKAALGGASSEGLAGLRINHNLDIEVRDFGVKR